MNARRADPDGYRRAGFWRGVGVALAAIVVATGIGLVFGLWLHR